MAIEHDLEYAARRLGYGSWAAVPAATRTSKRASDLIEESQVQANRAYHQSRREREWDGGHW